MSDSNGSGGAFMAGFILGGLVGAAAALLLSPQPGEMTRKQILERSSGLQEQLGPLGERAATVRERASGLAAKVQERGKILIEEMQASGQEQAE